MSGAKHYEAGAMWPCGIMISWRKSSNGLLIDMQGQFLSSTPVDEFMNLTREIMMHGFHCTRIDLAVDHVGMDLNLYTNAVESCESGCLCKLRTHAPNPEYKADGTVTRRLLKIGQRGSPVCVRIYDKGLHTKLFPCGHWERFEVEFKDDKAPEVCMALVRAGDELPDLIWRYVIGAVDFRIKNGRSELDRRPRSGWWDEYVGHAVPILNKPIRKESGFESWCNHFRVTAGARLIQLSNILGMTPQQFFSQLIEGLEPSTTVVPATVDAKNYIQSFKDTPR
ncbi:MAG: replication initiation factor domain-containing protein [Phycisphaerales bacterium]|nr:replication initiation factor domain-containing protein [Phycisphaerales bacterium]